MLIYPAIDILGGSAVRLRQGDFERSVTYSSDPVEVAHGVEASGLRNLHVIDLDGARTGIGVNAEVIRRMCGGSLRIQVGGGIRTREAIETVLSWGVQRVIVGSAAVRHPEFVRDWVDRYGADKVVVAIDARNGMLATDGWTTMSTRYASSMIDRCASYGARTFICTDTEKDGMLNGPSFPWYQEIRGAYPNAELIASGGIASLADIRRLAALGMDGVIVGKAIYDGRVTLGDLAAQDAEQRPHAR